MNTLIEGTLYRSAHKKAALALLALEWASRTISREDEGLLSPTIEASMQATMRIACRA